MTAPAAVRSARVSQGFPWPIRDVRLRALRDGALLAGFLFAFTLVFIWGPNLTWWSDALSWWTVDLNDLYGRANASLMTPGAFRFAPLVGQLMAPLALIPWPAFIALYLAANALVLFWFGGKWAPLFLAFPPIVLELQNGNIHLFMAAAIVAGFRFPAAWTLILLTKITPGVGLVWFAVRREWRALAIVAAVTATVVVVGVALTPDLWAEWVRTTIGSATMPAERNVSVLPLALRLPLAALLVGWGARTDRRWTVPVAAVIAMPTIWIQSLAILAAIVPLERERLRNINRRASPDERALTVQPAARS